MKINQITGTVAAQNAKNTAVTDRTDDTHTLSLAPTPVRSATLRSSVSSTTVSSTVADNRQDIDTARVNMIRDAIENGSFNIDVAKIADGLINNTR